MAITVKHNKVSTIPDTTDTSLVRPSDWNADHTLVGTIDVANGGTGASTLTGYVKGNGTSAMTAVATVPSTDITGLGTMSTQNATAVAITGGTINGTTIGATTPSSVNATTITGQTGVLRGTGQNLLLQSQDFTTSWTNTATTDTANTQIAPDGTLTADTLTAQATTNFHDLTQSIAVNSANRTLSIFLKKGTHDYFQLCFLGDATPFANFDLGLGVVGTKAASVTSSITSVGNDWYRCTVEYASSTVTFVSLCMVSSASAVRRESWTATGTETVFLWGAQLELGSTANTYIPTTTTAIYGTPTLSFSGVSTIGLESNGALFVQPAGTGALQAQATTSSTAGGNARGANAVDWQTVRSAASQVASGSQAFIGAGRRNTASGEDSFVGGGFQNTASSSQASVVSGARNNASGGTSFIGSGNDNTANLTYGTVVGGQSNTASGYFGFVGNGASNSTTSSSAVTTQATTAVTSGSTAVTLSGSNANIKVGQLVVGTGITFPTTYVAAISGTSLTLNQNATATGTPTLSFFTPHGVVVGGGNNQATGSYSFIGGGGDAGTAANRNVASGDWSFVGGGRNNTASGNGSVICGGGLYAVLSPTTFANVATGNANFIGAGISHTCSGDIAAIVGGQAHTASGARAFVGGGLVNTASGAGSAIMGGQYGTTRGIEGNHVFPACAVPIASTIGISQAALLVLAVQTTDATATALRSNSSAASTTNQVILPNNSAYFFRGEVISGVTGGGNTKGFTIEGVIKRGANAAATTLVGSTVVSTFGDAGAATWTIALTADTTNGGLRVTFTGQAATTIRTVCQIRTTEMTY
jgi:hypothetical protein